MFDAYLANTWIAGTVVALSAGIIGIFVVLRGDSFLAHAIPHGSFAGAAAAIYLGVSSVVGMGLAALAAAVGISLLGRKRQRRDTVIALTLVFLLAGGAFLLSLGGNYTNQVYALLFGQVLAVADSDLVLMTALAIFGIIVVAIIARPLLLSSVMPELAEARGIHNGVIEFVFTLVIAAVTTASVPVVGAMLLFSLLVAPPAAACLLCSRPVRAGILSCVFSLLCMWLSIALSVVTDMPVGFFVALTCACIYAIAKITSIVRAR
ncbi:metal ABC transporter permease [Bifidobacterium subtile]|jgi:zinc/manganese transport system permease protein|uniref:metal ABC transporter permease n=1 Tax=Bifidobacterium subtile TaxID=77635 RepID=UPI002F354401|nr:metal ABC transporter permease [Bifidobacterium subtile]